MTEQNPYAAPTTGATSDEISLAIDSSDQKKIDAVIKDAGQFWLAIILCILCSAIGAFIIPIWYSVRLIQWHRLAKKYPGLISQQAPSGSVQAKFQSSQWKLIVGGVIGAFILVCLIAYVFLLAFTMSTLAE